MINVKIPGKLYIAGEYAVVSPGRKSIIMAVNKFINVNIEKTHSGGYIKSFKNEVIPINRVNGKIESLVEDERFIYILKAIETTEDYLKEKKVNLELYKIDVTSDLDSPEGKKYGLGSSGAVVVAIVKSILKLYKIKHTKLDIFKLSVASSLKVSSKGSFGDIASAVYGGIIKYQSIDTKSILKKLDTKNILDLINSNWQPFKISHIPINHDINIIVGWTQIPASSVNLVDKTLKNKQYNYDFYEYFLKKNDELVDEFEKFYINGDYKNLKNTVEKLRKLLNEFASNYDINLEINKLKELINIANKYDFKAKSSGAGGGDCGIVFSRKNDNILDLENEWGKFGIKKLNLEIYEDYNE